MLHTQTVYPATLSLLRELMSIKGLEFYTLAGGTALALQIGHRISVDLDFFGVGPHDHDDVLKELKHFDKVNVLSRSSRIMTLTVDDVKVDFVNYFYEMIGEPRTLEGIRLYPIEDIAAMKIGAIVGRGRKRDFFDLYFLIGKLGLANILKFYEKKYPEGSAYLAFKSLMYFGDADTDDDPELFNPVTWDDVKKTIITETNKIVP